MKFCKMAGTALFATALVVASASPSSATLPDTIVLFRDHLLGAQATFTTTTGSVETTFFVGAGMENLQFGAPPGPGAFSSAVASLLEVDTITGSGFFADCIPAGSSPFEPRLPDGAFVVAQNLSSASLHAVFDCFGNPGTPPQLTVDIMWAGTGMISARAGSVHLHEPDLFVNGAFQGLFVFEATATGTVSDGSRNFTPNPADFAPIFRFGTEQIAIG